MITFLATIFLKQKEQGDLRKGYGFLCGLVGIGLNLLLFAGKFFAGTRSGSIAITADAFNNLSDAGSSVVTLLGFQLAGQKPDPNHPFGHGRLEYISGLVVSLMIVLMGVELGKSSVDKILHPESVSFSWLVVAILVVYIVVKFYMFYYNRVIGRKIQSPAMEATATDSLSDTGATIAVLIATFVGQVTGLQIDGWCGLVVAGFILVAGLRAGKETLDPLLGAPPSKELVAEIHQMVMSHTPILGIHDLVVHDYGPGRRMISLHAEVPAEGDFLDMHDVVDNVELALRQKLNCEAVIHMDPIVTKDGITGEIRNQVEALVKDLDAQLCIHDFRMVIGPTHTNLIFDLVVPFGFSMSDGDVEQAVSQKIVAMNQNFRAVMLVEKQYI